MKPLKAKIIIAAGNVCNYLNNKRLITAQQKILQISESRDMYIFLVKSTHP